MSKKKITTQQLFSKELKNANKKAFESFDFYKKTTEIIDKANAAMGKKSYYSTTQTSTSNYKIGINGLSSTQKI